MISLVSIKLQLTFSFSNINLPNIDDKISPYAIIFALISGSKYLAFF